MAYREHIEIPISKTFSVELRERYVDLGKPTEHMRWIAGTVGEDRMFNELKQEHEGTLASALAVASCFVTEHDKSTMSKAALAEVAVRNFRAYTQPMYPSLPGGC